MLKSCRSVPVGEFSNVLALIPLRNFARGLKKVRKGTGADVLDRAHLSTFVTTKHNAQNTSVSTSNAFLRIESLTPRDILHAFAVEPEVHRSVDVGKKRFRPLHEVSLHFS